MSLRLVFWLLLPALAISAQEPPGALDLERVVIKGRTQEPKLIEPELLPKGRPVPSIHDKILSPMSTSSSSSWRDQFSFGSGSFEHWQISNTIQKRLSHGHLGLDLHHHEESGDRYGKKARLSRGHWEWQKESPDPETPSWSLEYDANQSWAQVPAAIQATYNGREKKEFLQQIQANLQLPMIELGHMKLSATFRDGAIKDNTQSTFSHNLFRLGLLHRQGNWRTAFSFDRDNRDSSRSLLSRFFVENVSTPLGSAELSWGTGLYLYSHTTVTSTALQEEDKGLEFSPSLALRHAISPRGTAYIQLSRLLQSWDFVETHYDRIYLDSPTRVITPSKLTRIEAGIHHDFLQNLRASISIGEDRLRQYPVEVNAANDLLRIMHFDKGRMRKLHMHIESSLGDAKLSLNNTWITSTWDNEMINYTPNHAAWVTELESAWTTDRADLLVGCKVENNIRTYPVQQNLPTRVSIRAKSNWHLSSFATWWLQIDNLLNRENPIALNYPDTPFRITTGMRLDL